MPIYHHPGFQSFVLLPLILIVSHYALTGHYFSNTFFEWFNFKHDLSRSTSRSRVNSTHYTAAVVEYQPEGAPWEDSGPEIISKNLAKYLIFIGNASANNADIIVFPEYGLTTLGIPRDRDSAKPFLLRVAEIGSNPCNNPDDSTSSPEIRTLSCAAQSANIYLVVNLGEIRPCSINNPNCPPDGGFQFNTNVVFDREGTIVAKYEKANLYFEDQFDKPDPIGLSTFGTDFGVEFGLFTCFDIIFYRPAVQLVERGIRHFIFPTAWVDELPFLMAIQAQSSWSHGAGANFLASGYHQPLGGQLGSGLYSGVNGAVTYTFNSESGSKMLIGQLPISLESSASQEIGKLAAPIANISATHSYLREDLQNYTTAILDLSLERKEICTGNGFCCEVAYKMANTGSDDISQNSQTYRPDDILQNSQTYRLIAFNGTRTVAAKTAEYDWQVCGIVRCGNASLASCSQNLADNETLPNFEVIKLRTRFDIRTEDGVKANFQPTFSTLDINFDLISPVLFRMESNSDTGAVIVSSNNETLLRNVEIKTLALIHKLFDDSANAGTMERIK